MAEGADLSVCQISLSVLRTLGTRSPGLGVELAGSLLEAIACSARHGLRQWSAAVALTCLSCGTAVLTMRWRGLEAISELFTR